LSVFKVTSSEYENVPHSLKKKYIGAQEYWGFRGAENVDCGSVGYDAVQSCSGTNFPD
jgi:hypothetical protein